MKLALSLFIALFCAGCVTAEFQQPDGTKVGYTSWFKDVSASGVEAAAPNGASLKITGAQSTVNTQLTNQLIQTLGVLGQQYIQATGGLPIAPSPVTQPATQPAARR